MPMRLGGLSSGMDTDAVVKELMAAHKIKKEGIVKKQTKLEWKKDIWTTLNTKIYDFYTKNLSAAKLQGSYNTKKVSSTNTDKAEITSKTSGVEGNHTIAIKQVATAGFLTSGKLNADAGTKLTDLGIAQGTQFSIKVGSKDEKKITVDASTTMESFAKELSDCGLNANFDATQKRLFISSKSSGLDNEFSITATEGAGASGLAAVAAKNLASATTALDNADKALTAATAAKASAPTDFANSMYGLVGLPTESSNDTSAEAATRASVDTLLNDIKNGNDTAKANAKTALEGMVGSFLTSKGLDPSSAGARVDNQVSSYEDAMSGEATAQAARDTAQNNYDAAVIADADAKAAAALAPTDTTSSTATALKNLNLVTSADGADASTAASRINAKDCIIEYNGAELQSASNKISVNGLDIVAKDITDATNPIKITVTKDVESTYKFVKDFVTEYNKLLTEMNTLYGAAASKGYEPLTDDEKEAMSDTQVTNWEKKIKDSLLRRDTNLNSVISMLKNNMGSVVNVDGNRRSLSDYGISTSTNYLEGGLLHIYGDKDDSTYADKDDKLRKALEEDPDSVIGTLTTIAGNLYSEMSSKMKSSSIRSAFSFYNDKQMTKEIDSYKSRTKELETKFTRLEESYYKKFSAMETAMAKINSQSSQLSGMLGV